VGSAVAEARQGRSQETNQKTGAKIGNNRGINQELKKKKNFSKNGGKKVIFWSTVHTTGKGGTGQGRKTLQTGTKGQRVGLTHLTRPPRKGNKKVWETSAFWENPVLLRNLGGMVNEKKGRHI